MIRLRWVSLLVAMWIGLDAWSAGRPNVILIMTDNHGAWTLGCYGNREIRTPNIDRLAAEGTLFTRAFASNPVCSPTRATCLTGLVPSQHGVHSFLTGGNLQVGPKARNTLAEFTSLPEVLRDAGYRCGLVGKWHLGDNLFPQEGMDDYWITMPHGGTSTFYDAAIIENGKQRKEPSYLTDFWTEHAVRFIDQQAEAEQPFFLFLAYNGPYALSRLLLREGQNRHAEYYADQPLLSFPRSKPHPWQLNNRDYINHPTSIRRVATEVSGVDDGVGVVMEALRRHNIDDDTLVVFLADQGWVGGQGGFFGMGDHTRPLTARDGMMQIPLIWRHPQKVSAGVRDEQLIANYDLMPTLLGHLGLGHRMPATPKSPGTDYSGRLLTSTAKTLMNEESDSAVFYEFENLRCVRTDTFKYVHRHPNGPHELYDLRKDPDEFTNLYQDSGYAATRRDLKHRLDQFYAEYALPKYDLWKEGTSQVRIHDGIDEETSQHVAVNPPELPSEFQPAPIEVPDGFEVELVAGPPLVMHPTMACFDDRGRLYVCNNAGVNMSNEELEANLPNQIRRLEDRDGDGQFDSMTVFADNMTFPMGGVWKQGALYVASPPNIWKLTDADDDGIAEQREVLVEQFGYTGNAASIHGCFAGPDGRIYWTDGYHGHRFTDAEGRVTSQREGSYLFSCRDDGSDIRTHCGGGMDNPVELDFTAAGDMLGTVNILYTRPRVDCFVHWLRGGAYPHRAKVLDELDVTGPLLGPVHRFGHVAVSGATRYRSGAMDHRWGDNWFTTFFNSGKVVRLALERAGSTYEVVQSDFLSCSSREFHPTDVLEDADGSLLVVDTGGWFYRGCPTSQFSKPDLLGGIYRVKRSGMTTLVDPRGQRVDWEALSPSGLVRKLNDTRFEVRRQAIDSCATRGGEVLPTLRSQMTRGDRRTRQNIVWVMARLIADPQLSQGAIDVLRLALVDRVAEIRQAACYSLSLAESGASDGTQVDPAWLTPRLRDEDAGVRRQAADSLGKIGNRTAVRPLIDALRSGVADRSEQHAIVHSLIELSDVEAIRQATPEGSVKPSVRLPLLTAIEQIDAAQISFDEVLSAVKQGGEEAQAFGTRVFTKYPQWADSAALAVDSVDSETATVLVEAYLAHQPMAEVIGRWLASDQPHRIGIAMSVLARSGRMTPHDSWVKPLQQKLNSPDATTVQHALASVSSLSGTAFDQSLQRLAVDPDRTPMQQVEAINAMVAQRGRLTDETLQQLIDIYAESGSPAASEFAVQIIGRSNLNDGQLKKVLPLVEVASVEQLRHLLGLFGRRFDEPAAMRFLDAIEASPSWESLSEPELSDVVKRFPVATFERANTLLDRLKSLSQVKVARLEQLRDQISTGDPARGRALFISKRAKCSTCHRVGKEGKAVGPDLTTIGGNRSASDLIESILFPSASIVRDYQTYQLLTSDGRAFTGLVIRESRDRIELQLASGETKSFDREEIEQIQVNPVSIMPSGLDDALTEAELIDIVAYLGSLR
ncbi:MAG: sulfatase-like hydrolase/transferase [Rubripirellula sp.]|nr:sulfatase-like hydrolase/transferase [Rubripirellula sp.]